MPIISYLNIKGDVAIFQAFRQTPALASYRKRRGHIPLDILLVSGPATALKSDEAKQIEIASQTRFAVVIEQSDFEQ